MKDQAIQYECNQCYEEYYSDMPEASEVFEHNYEYTYEDVKSIGKEIICGHCITEGILDMSFDTSFEFLQVQPKVRYPKPFEQASAFAIWLAVYHGQLDPSCIHPESITQFRKVRDKIEQTFPEKEIITNH